MWYEAAPAIRKMWVQFLYLVVIGSLVKRVFNSSVWLKTWFSSFNSLDKYLNREYTFDKLKITYFYWPLNDIFNSLGGDFHTQFVEQSVSTFSVQPTHPLLKMSVVIKNIAKLSCLTSLVWSIIFCCKTSYIGTIGNWTTAKGLLSMPW